MIVIKTFEELCALDPQEHVLIVRFGHCTFGGDQETGFGTEVAVGHVVRVQKSTGTAYIGRDPTEPWSQAQSITKDDFVSGLHGTQAQMHELALRMLRAARPVDVFAHA